MQENQDCGSVSGFNSCELLVGYVALLLMMHR